MIVGLDALLRRLAPSVAATLLGGLLIGELSGFIALTLPISLYFALNKASPAAARGASDAAWGCRSAPLSLAPFRRIPSIWS